MPTMQEVRAKFPMYDDMSDEALAGALHRKFYSDLPEAEFRSKIGLASTVTAEPPAAIAPPAPMEGSGLALNTTAGANSALYSTLGAPVDLVRGAMNLGISGYNAATGSEVTAIPDDSFGGSKSIAQAMGTIDPVLDPANTKAVTTGERIARGVGEGAGYALAPEAALAAAVRSGTVAPRAAEIAGKVLGRGETVGAAATNAAIGGVSGGGSVAAMEATPDAYDPLSGMAGGLAAGGVGSLAASIPTAARASASMIGDYIAPMTEAGRQRLAGRQFREGMTDVQDVRETLDAMPTDLVPGSIPTTGQVTGDRGLLTMERGSAVRRPDIYAERRETQNTARRSAMDGLQSGGAPEKVADAFRARMQAIDDDLALTTTQAQEAARTSAANLGAGMTPDVAGDRLRGSLEEARKAAKAKERALWEAVDPDGSLVLAPTNARTGAADILKSVPKSAKPIDGEEAAILGTLSGYGDAVPFTELRAAQSRLTDAMRAERSTNGETAAYARMSRVNSAIHDDLARVVKAKVMREEFEVQNGRMDYDQTLLANLQREQQGWFDRRRAATGTEVGGNGPVGYGAGGSSSIPGLRGAAGESSRGPVGPTSNSRVPSGDAEPNFDDAALGRLKDARAATNERVDTFDNATLAPLRARGKTTGPYDLPSSAVPARLFFPQAKSFDAIQQARVAIGEERLFPAIQDYAIDRARKLAMRDDGTFDPAKLQAFRRSHADALRAVPGLDAKFTDVSVAAEAMGEAARRQAVARANAQRGSLGKLLQIDTPEDVTRTIGGIFNAQDANRRMQQVRSAVAGDAEAQKGLRQAVADHVRREFISNGEAGASGQGAIKADGFQSFVRKNASTLRMAGFNADEIKVMQGIADDLQRANRSITAVKNPGGSNTAQDAYAATKGGQPTILTRLLANVPAAVGAATGGVGGFMIGGPIVGFLGLTSSGVAAKTIADMRLAGINTVQDLIDDALLNPSRGRVLLMTPSERTLAPTIQTLGQMYRRSTATTGVVSTTGDGGTTEGGEVAMMPGAAAVERQPLEITIGRSAR